MIEVNNNDESWEINIRLYLLALIIELNEKQPHTMILI